ncbi:MAG TPA: glycosyltransferase, partial [Stellaceae bacterium]|nr:glycosyltransferase [Stellaceae bacterium]
ATDPRQEPRPTLFRFVSKRLPPVTEGRFHVVAFDRLPSEIFAGLLERPVKTLPMPYRAVAPLRSRAGAAPPTVAILGHQKFQKGYDRLPEILTALLRLPQEFRLLVQHVDPRGPEELQQAVRAVAHTDARVILEESPAGRTGWPLLLERSDLILTPHRPEFYAGFSAVGAEAIANGIPLVVPPGTPIERLVRESGGGGLSFERFEPAAIADATSRALSDFDALADRAYAAALRWPTWQGPARLADALLALVAA